MSSSPRKPRKAIPNGLNINTFPYPQVTESPMALSSYSSPASEAQSTKISPSTSMTTLESGRSSVVQQPLADDEDNIKVVVRIRPMNTLEKQRTDGQAVFCMADGQTVQVQKLIDGKPVHPMTFHHVFEENTEQENMFEKSGVKYLVEKAVEGYNSTVFAYGQTGSGKTFTITGPDDITFTPEDSHRWGVVPRSLKHVFSLLSQNNASVQTTVYASYIEIYNEQVQDLLNPTNSSLPVRWSTEKGFYVENIFIVECEVLDDCLAVMEEGLRNRKVASHKLNEHSSRSHGLMAITIETETTDPDDGRIIRKKGKITFVDLAGSEKLKESKATGETLTETLNINKSLHTLGNCISALADMRKGKKSGVIHVPYRDSKLTKLLSDSIGGNGIALMIACVSPSAINVNETLNTLRYASRAKRIRNKPVIQMDPREELIIKLKAELKKVSAENDSLRQTIMEFSMGNTPTTHNPKGPARIAPSGGSENTMLLNKVMDENKSLLSKNKELSIENQKIQHDKEELLKENEKLISKMEKFSQIFTIPDNAAQQDGPPPAAPTERKKSKSLGITDTKTEKPPLFPAKKGIDRSAAHLEELKDPHPPKPKNNDELRKEVQDLEKQIHSLEKGSKSKKAAK